MNQLSNNKWKIEDIPDQSGKTIIITGSNSGLGYRSALELAKKGAKVIMTSRSMEKGNEALNEIKSQLPSADIHLIQLDLASQKSIKTFAEQVNKDFEVIDVLINNAGVMQPPYRTTEEGIELQLGVNHIGHYLLTGLLLPLLKKSNDPRVINQSSIAHLSGRMNFDDINSEKSYSRTNAYGQSKLANLLFTYELDRKLKASGVNIKSIGVHPGYTATNLQHAGPTIGGKSFFSRLYTVTNKLMAQNIKMGVLPMLYAATMSDVESGDYLGPKKMGGARGYTRRIKSSERSYSVEDAQKLWSISEKLTGHTYSI